MDFATQERKLYRAVQQENPEMIIRLIEEMPELIWDGVVKQNPLFRHAQITGTLAMCAASMLDVRILKRMNEIIHEVSSPLELEERLTKAFERRCDTLDAVGQAAVEGDLSCLDYLVKHCCPSGVGILEQRYSNGWTPLTYAIRCDEVNIIAYIFRTAPRRLDMMHDVDNCGKSNWELAKGNTHEVDSYLCKIRSVMLVDEQALVQQALEHLESMNGNLPCVVLGIINEQNRVTVWRRSRLGQF